VKRETKDLPVYALEQVKGGSKLQRPRDAEGDPYFRVFQRRQITAKRAPLAYLTDALSMRSPDEMQVHSDENPSATDATLPNFSSALAEQLGLRVQSQKGPVEIIVIERAEKPAEN
jgi:hypothetical protein